MIRALLASDLLRFGTVSVLGLGLDLSTAAGLSVFLNVSLPLAAVVGFVTGAVANYVLHEIWTFPSTKLRLSGRRWLLYLSSLTITLLTRAGMVALLSRLLSNGAGQKVVMLMLAVGVSFLVHYILSKYIVFSPHRGRGRLVPNPDTK